LTRGHALRRRPLSVQGSASHAEVILIPKDMFSTSLEKAERNPVLLSADRSLLSGFEQRVPMDLTRATTFSSGNVLLQYRPAS
jgi:hypothetical protein